MTALTLPVILYLTSFCFARGAGVNSLIKIDASAAGRDNFSFTAQQKTPESLKTKAFGVVICFVLAKKMHPLRTPRFIKPQTSKAFAA